MVAILAAGLGLPAVAAAWAEALAEAVYSADVIRTILARRRDPVAPIAIGPGGPQAPARACG